MRLKEVTPDDIQAVLAGMTGKSASLQSKVFNMMKKIFDVAIDNNLIIKNPCAKLKPGGKRTPEKDPLTAQQVETLIEAVHGTRSEPFVMLGIYAGLHREEILGLQWDCVFLDEDAPYLSVRRALRWEKCRPIVSDELKTKAAKRKIPIPPQLEGYLNQVQGAPDKYVVGVAPLSAQQYRNLWYPDIAIHRSLFLELQDFRDFFAIALGKYRYKNSYYDTNTTVVPG